MWVEVMSCLPAIVGCRLSMHAQVSLILRLHLNACKGPCIQLSGWILQGAAEALMTLDMPGGLDSTTASLRLSPVGCAILTALLQLPEVR